MTGLNQISKSAERGDLINEMILQKNKLLDHLIKLLNSCSDYKFRFGIESEFYLIGKNSVIEPYLVNDLIDKCLTVPLFKSIVPESGNCQFEYLTDSSSDLVGLLNASSAIKSLIIDNIDYHDIKTDFSPLPFSDDCANALQISFSVFSGRENLIFTDEGFVFDLAGFLVSKMDDLTIFANALDSDFKRYNVDYNRKIHRVGKFVAPTVKSWGFDNRSCAVRVLRSDNESARVEIRIASNNCCIELFCCVLLYILSQFLESSDVQSNIGPIYGNSFDNQYDLPNLISCQKGALQQLYNNKEMLQFFISKLDLPS